MVLVSSEWQNKCEDVPKTNAVGTTTSGTYTTTTPTTSVATTSAVIIVDPSVSTPGSESKIIAKSNQYKSETVAAEDLLNSITDTVPILSTSAIETRTEFPESEIITLNKCVAADNVNNEPIFEILKDKNKYTTDIVDKNDDDISGCKIAEVEKLFSSAQQLKVEDNLEESALNHNNIKIMAENTKEFPMNEEKEEEDSHQSSYINNHFESSNKNINESNSYLNSDTNTLTTSSITVKTQQEQHLPHTCPITPLGLSSALQSALNATNNANNANISVPAAGMQPNFLSQLALTANVAGLQKSTTTTSTILTAKQMNQSFNMLDSSNENKSDSNHLESTTSTTVVPAIPYDNNGQSKIVLICEGNSHPFQTRTISLTPNIECMVGRLIAKSKASENNAIFDCKVLSRKHAVIWYTPDGKFWVKDTKSSNGTFINDNKLGDEEAELHFSDIVKFGVDVLENSRKEVHGCIIARVKLYLPDGREAISIDSSASRSQYSGEGRISYDELHRLNLYIQETSQREKVLTSKLCNIQNVLDATRKNSALCWQSMITEDQLLHRIHSLEKKLQFIEKNVPENILRNEVLKLIDDKSLYQHTAKEALRKVYQERCDAMQMLAKMELACAQSDNECSVLRDQIMNSKQTFQDLNTRLLHLETEYNEYKDEVARQQQEAKDLEEMRITELTGKLRECEMECEDLKKKISELLIKRAEFLVDEEILIKRAGLIEDEEQLLEKQAIEKLDAAIADMDLGDDEDSSDEYENDRDVEKLANVKEHGQKGHTVVREDNENEFAIIKKKPIVRPQLASIFGDYLNGVDEKPKLKKASDASTHKSPPKRVKETTIMKWLENSDLNKNEQSFDIFKAICNENENEEVSDDAGVLTEQELNDTRTIETQNSHLFYNFANKLINVQKNLKQLEDEIQNGTNKNAYVKDDGVQFKVKSEHVEDGSSDDEDANDAKDGACADKEFIVKSNGNADSSSQNQVLSKENKKYLLLKSSLNMLREICDNVRRLEDTRFLKQMEPNDGNEKYPSINIYAKKKFQLCDTNPTSMSTMHLDKKISLRSSESDNTESDSENESLTLSSPINSSLSMTVIDVKSVKRNDELLEQLKEYQSQVVSLNDKLQQTELQAQHTLEIMQVECDDVKLKMENLNKVIEVLKSDKIAMEQAISENEKGVTALETSSPNTKIATQLYKENVTQLENELELEGDLVFNSISITALEREEELITYKERLDEQQRENIDLRNEIALLKLKSNASSTKDLMLKQYVTCGVIVLAIIIYFVATYY